MNNRIMNKWMHEWMNEWKEKIYSALKSWLLSSLIYLPLWGGNIIDVYHCHGLPYLSQIYRYVFDTTLSGNRQRVVADFIVHSGLANEALRDEIYIQLCNQSFPRPAATATGDGSATQRTWQLMAHCLSCFKPSNTLYNYLLKSVNVFVVNKSSSSSIADKLRDDLHDFIISLCVKNLQNSELVNVTNCLCTCSS